MYKLDSKETGKRYKVTCIKVYGKRYEVTCIRYKVNPKFKR